jgi:hypothetical protein
MARTLALHDYSFMAGVGEELSVSDEQADALVNRGNAVYLDGVPVREILITEHPVTGTGGNSGTEYTFGETAPVVPAVPEELKRPWGNATKGEWIKYALAADPDLTEEAANDMSKVQLMQAYGERL